MVLADSTAASARASSHKLCPAWACVAAVPVCHLAGLHTVPGMHGLVDSNDSAAALPQSRREQACFAAAFRMCQAAGAAFGFETGTCRCLVS